MSADEKARQKVLLIAGTIAAGTASISADHEALRKACAEYAALAEVVTEEMIDAGVSELRHRFDVGHTLARSDAETIYMAMRRARPLPVEVSRAEVIAEWHRLSLVIDSACRYDPSAASFLPALQIVMAQTRTLVRPTAKEGE